MLKEERHQFIINEVELHNKVLLTDLSESLNVSIDTVRRDVKELHKLKKLKKVHGGAISLGFESYSRSDVYVYALEKKKIIARKAIELLKSGDAILIHGGTTCIEFAKLMPSKLDLTCFTLSLPVAMELVKKSNVKVIFIGGVLSNHSQISVGGKAVHELSHVKMDYSFIGSGYINTTYGLSGSDWENEQVKKSIINASKKTILLTISEKLNTQQRFKTCDLGHIHTMITELDPTDEKLTQYKQHLNLL